MIKRIGLVLALGTLMAMIPSGFLFAQEEESLIPSNGFESSIEMTLGKKKIDARFTLQVGRFKDQTCYTTLLAYTTSYFRWAPVTQEECDGDRVVIPFPRSLNKNITWYDDLKKIGYLEVEALDDSWKVFFEGTRLVISGSELNGIIFDHDGNRIGTFATVE